MLTLCGACGGQRATCRHSFLPLLGSWGQTANRQARWPRHSPTGSLTSPQSFSQLFNNTFWAGWGCPALRGRAFLGPTILCLPLAAWPGCDSLSRGLLSTHIPLPTTQSPPQQLQDTVSSGAPRLTALPSADPTLPRQVHFPQHLTPVAICIIYISVAFAAPQPHHLLPVLSYAPQHL